MRRIPPKKLQKLHPPLDAGVGVSLLVVGIWVEFVELVGVDVVVLVAFEVFGVVEVEVVVDVAFVEVRVVVDEVVGVVFVVAFVVVFVFSAADILMVGG